MRAWISFNPRTWMSLFPPCDMLTIDMELTKDLVRQDLEDFATGMLWVNLEAFSSPFAGQFEIGQFVKCSGTLGEGGGIITEISGEDIKLRPCTLLERRQCGKIVEFMPPRSAPARQTS